MVRHQTGTWRYRAETNATVTLTGDTAAPTAPTAPLRSVVIYNITLDTAAGGFHVAGRIDSTMLSAGGRVPARPADTLKPIFSARFDTLAGLIDLSMETDEQPLCAGGIDPIVAGVQGLFVTVPSRLRPGVTWQDSTTTVTCRGSVAVTSAIHRVYTVVDSTAWNGQPAVRIDIATTSTLAGAGMATAAGDSITVHGTGTASGSMLVDPETAMPFSSTMTGRASVSVYSRQTTLPFDQQVNQTITLLDRQAEP